MARPHKKLPAVAAKRLGSKARWLQTSWARALCIWLILALAEHVLQDTVLTEWLTQQAYAFLHVNTPLDRGHTDLPVVIVDISRWRSTNSLSAVPGVPGLFVRSSVDFWDRAALTALLKRLAFLEPAAIGVDIDFSPLTAKDGSDGEPPKNDLSFLDCSENLKTPGGTNIPVRLGIERSIESSSPPAGWLGSTEHQGLAAAISRLKGRNSHMPYELRMNINSPPVPSLSKALVDAWSGSNRFDFCTLPRWIHPLLCLNRKEYTSSMSKEVWYSSFPVNYYSTLPALKESKIYAESILDGSAVRKGDPNPIYHKVVLIGTATPGESFDTVCVPAEPDPVPGIYKHACAVATFLAKPMFELNEPAGLLLSFLCSLLVWAVGHRMQTSYEGKPFKTLTFELVIVIVALTISYCIGVSLIRWAGILWLQITVLWFFLIAEFALGIIAASIFEEKVAETKR